MKTSWDVSGSVSVWVWLDTPTFPPCSDIYDSPVYMWPHSKVVLVQAIIADTLFLANNHIMDYSLLVGLDREKGEVVLGIIGRVNVESSLYQ